MFRRGWWKSTSPMQAYALIQTAAWLAIAVHLFESIRRDENQSGMYPYQVGFDAIGIVAFASLAVHLVFQVSLRRRQRCYTMVGFLSFYLLSYAALSSAGDYHAARSGRYRWKTAGLAVADESIWHAKGVFFHPSVDVAGQTRFEATTLGWYFSALVYLDRLYWHKSSNLVEQIPDQRLMRHPAAIQHD